MADTLDTRYQKATVDVKKLTKPVADETLLKLYALFKVASGEDIEKARSLGFLELREKVKRNEWRALVDKNYTPDQAKQEYIDIVEGLKETHGYDENKDPEEVRK